MISWWTPWHFLLGAMFYSCLAFITLAMYIKVLIVISFKLLWEVFEFCCFDRIGIKHNESVLNAIMDVIAGVLGFCTLWLLDYYGKFDRELSLAITTPLYVLGGAFLIRREYVKGTFNDQFQNILLEG